jgi:hypothetical protein
MSATGQERITPPVIVVSGLPRSGTSLMMKMVDVEGMYAAVNPDLHRNRTPEELHCCPYEQVAYRARI